MVYLHMYNLEGNIGGKILEVKYCRLNIGGKILEGLEGVYYLQFTGT